MWEEMGSELVDINSRKPLAQDCGREGRVIATAVQERIKAYCTWELSTYIQVQAREDTEEEQMETGTAEGPGRGGSPAKTVGQYEQHKERPRGRKPPWKKLGTVSQ